MLKEAVVCLCIVLIHGDVLKRKTLLLDLPSTDCDKRQLPDSGNKDVYCTGLGTDRKLVISGGECVVSGTEFDTYVQYVYECQDRIWVKAGQPSKLERLKRWDWISGVVGDIASAISCLSNDIEGANQPPTFSSNCPPADLASEYVIADGSDVTAVAWTAPTATDSDGTIQSVTQVVGGQSGSDFQGSVWGRQHTIVYVATGSNGLKASCTFDFKVTVPTCATLAWPDNGAYVCSHGNQTGSTCTYTCNAGYELSGLTTTTCQSSGWTTIPTCQEISCGVPSAMENGDVACGDSAYTYGSTCTLGCHVGFRLEGSLYTSCAVDGSWTTAQSTECIDDTPPNIFCLSPQIFYADRGQTSASVTPEVPVATDNLDANPTVVKVSGPASGATLVTGSYNVQYKAVDADGNESPECTIETRVQVLTCGHPLETLSDTNLEFTCTGYTYGDQCALDCYHNLPLEGTALLMCERNDTGATPKGYWSWGSGSEPYCNSVVCPSIDPPMNGSIAYSTVGGALAYAVSCDSPFSVPSMGTLFTGLILCHSSGWSPDFKSAPDCVITKRAVIRYNTEILYYSGDCSDPTQLSSFEAELQTKVNQASAQLQGLCPSDVTCSAINPAVSCQDARKKRSVREKRNVNGHRGKWSDPLREMLESTHGIHKRQASSYFLILDFEIEAEFDHSSMSVHAMFNFADSLQTDTINPGLQAMIDNGDFDLTPWTLQSDSLQSALGETYCEPGYTLENVRICMPCPRGYYLSGSQCEECPVGQYSSDSGSVTCTSCSSGYSTRFTASESLDDCTEVCGAGSYSPDTLKPCASCPIGYYQTEAGQTTCVKCPAGKTTLTEGSTSESVCQYFDVLLDNTGVNIEIADVATLRNLTLMFWVKAATDSVPNAVLDINNVLLVSIADSIRVFTPSSSFDEAFDPASSEAWQHVTVRWETTAQTMSVFLNGQMEVSQAAVSPATNPLVQNGHVKISSNGASGVYLSGVTLRDDIISDLEVQNLATSCQTENDGDVVNMDVFSDLNSIGVTLIAPSACDAVDECQSSPCGSHRCYNQVGGYQCTCYDGWTGSTCNTAPNYCDTNDCMNGALCITNSANYTCQCQAGYSGTFCEQGPVDGGLSAWGTWSECSATCDTGTRSRDRSCDSPVPDVYGSGCGGLVTETESCSSGACPVCPTLVGDTATGYQCTTDVTSGIQTCTVQCSDGYVLPRGLGTDEYRCGLDTGYTWEPTEGLATCVVPVIPNSVILTSRVTYNTPIPVNHRSDAMVNVQNNMAGTDCHTSPTCQTEVTQLTTGTESLLAMLSTITLQDTSDLMFEQYVTSGLASSSLQAVIDATSTLESTAAYINASTSSIFDVTVSGVTYNVDPASLTMCVGVECETGHVPTNGLCATCPSGSYQSGDQCNLCERGSYQDQAGQTACTACPTGTSTATIGAISLTQCSGDQQTTGDNSEQGQQQPSDQDSEKDDPLLYIVIGVVGVVVLCSAVCVAAGVWYYKCSKNKKTIGRKRRPLDDAEIDNIRVKTLDRGHNVPAVVPGLAHNIPALSPGFPANANRRQQHFLNDKKVPFTLDINTEKEPPAFFKESKEVLVIPPAAYQYQTTAPAVYNIPAMQAWGHRKDCNIVRKGCKNIGADFNYEKAPIIPDINRTKTSSVCQKNKYGAAEILVTPAPPEYSFRNDGPLSVDDLDLHPCEYMTQENGYVDGEFNYPTMSPPPPYRE